MCAYPGVDGFEGVLTIARAKRQLDEDLRNRGCAQLREGVARDSIPSLSPKHTLSSSPKLTRGGPAIVVWFVPGSSGDL